MLVVDATTADPGIPGVRPIPVDEDHVTICKPASKDTRIYRQVKRLIEETVIRSGQTPQTAMSPPEDHAVEPTRYSGEIKIKICRRLVRDWQDLADYFEIQPYDRSRFTHGSEPQGVWEWLDDHNRLAELAQGLVAIGRHDLVEELRQPPPREARRNL
jgi:hypothetical protein